ncbi:MAG: hypothetical protein J6W19_09420, partial [Prevotella sp.]|nr:hypothetical protein [Prevotella sp.]
ISPFSFLIFHLAERRKPFFPIEKAVLSNRISRSFKSNKPFFLWEKAVLAPFHYASVSFVAERFAATRPSMGLG